MTQQRTLKWTILSLKNPTKGEMTILPLSTKGNDKTLFFIISTI